MASALSTREVNWAPTPNHLSLWASNILPSVPLTSVSAVLTTPSGLVGVHVRTRGWDLPGGHIDEGETAIQALLRETEEEAGLVLEPAAISLIGHTRLEVTGPRPFNYPYPYPSTAQLIFTAEIGDDVCHSLTPTVAAEVCEARMISWAEVNVVFADRVWLELVRAVFPHSM